MKPWRCCAFTTWRPRAACRALWIALDEWSTNHRQPPKSRVPQLKDGTLVPPLPQAGTGFPNIPGVTYTGLKTTRYHFDYGLHFYDTGIATMNHATIRVRNSDGNQVER